MEVLQEAPEASNFIPLVENQSRTPSSFYSGLPVLHCHCPDVRLVIRKEELRSSPGFLKLSDDDETQQRPAEDDNAVVAGDSIIAGVDVWITSSKFLLYRSSRSAGLSIAYPSILLHAIQRLEDPSSREQIQGIYLQIQTSDGFDDHDPEGSMSVTLLPPIAPDATIEQPTSSTATGAQGSEANTIANQLYTALSACANLHPDQASPLSDAENNDTASQNDGGEEGTAPYTSLDGLPPPLPGSGGWITAENVGEFFDEEGNWRGRGLGPGAGVVRERDEGPNGHSLDNGAGVNGDSEDAKWRRTD